MGGHSQAPEREHHTILHRAYRRSRTLETMWRMRYDLPATDPRYLEATEYEMLDDLLTCMYYDALVEETQRPLDALKRQMETFGEAFDEEDDAILADATDGDMAARLRKVIDLVEPVRKLERILFKSRMTA